MSLLEQLANNKGTVSSALGKELAEKVLNGQTDILYECIDLVCYQASNNKQKHIRSGAAKVVEIVAEKRPELVAPRLDKLLPALSVEEPQTRWMIIRTMGFCARLNQTIAQQAIPYAEKYIAKKEGLCLSSSADLFLGDLGALSKDNTEEVFPILELSMDTAIENEQDWLLETFDKLLPNLNSDHLAAVRKFAERWQYSSRKTTQRRAARILAKKVE
jgi:hypothetical protein